MNDIVNSFMGKYFLRLLTISMYCGSYSTGVKSLSLTFFDIILPPFYNSGSTLPCEWAKYVFRGDSRPRMRPRTSRSGP